MKKASLKCEVCGATESKSGKPFTPAGLGAHKAHLHGQEPKETEPGSEAAPLACDICGASQNSRGVQFKTDKNVAQHKQRIHGIVEAGEAMEAEPAPGALKSKKGRKVAYSPEANHVKFCPRCGFNMEIVNAAMALVNGN